MDKEFIKKELAKSLGDVWNKLSEDNKKEVIEKFIKDYLNPALKEVDDGLSLIRGKRESYGLMFIGLFLGLFGGLMAIILDRDLSRFGLWYEIIAPTVFLVLVVWVIRFLDKNISKEVERNEYLRGLLQAAREKNSRV